MKTRVIKKSTKDEKPLQTPPLRPATATRPASSRVTAGSRIPKRSTAVEDVPPDTVLDQKVPKNPARPMTAVSNKPVAKNNQTNLRPKPSQQISARRNVTSEKPAITPRRGASKAGEEVAPSKRPMTAGPTSRSRKPVEGVKKEDVPPDTRIKKIFDDENDHEEEIPDIPWLNEIDEITKRLDQNFLMADMIDVSPISLLDHASKKVENEMDQSADPFEVFHKIADEGFNQFHENMKQQGDLLQERYDLLRKIHDELIMHNADTDYPADTTLDDYDVVMPGDEEIMPVPSARPKTAGQRMRKV